MTSKRNTVQPRVTFLDLSQEVPTTDNLALLQQYVHLLLGRRLLRLDVVYLDELILHFEEESPAGSKLLPNYTKGAYSLSVNASFWCIEFRDRPMLLRYGYGPDKETDLLLVNAMIEEKGLLLQGLRVIEANVQRAVTYFVPGRRDLVAHGLELLLVLGNGARIKVSPAPIDADEIDIPDWDLFMPHRMMLRVGPGDCWEYVRSDVVARRLDGNSGDGAAV